MSVKRRDSKNRVLHTGESQRPDGRYAYKYTDAAGKPQFVYSWRLEPGDKLPKGKRDGPSLREKERQIKRDLEDGINPRGGEISVQELVQMYFQQRPPVRENTTHVREFVLQILERTGFGARRIDRVKQSDVKAWFISLQKSGKPDGTGYNYGSILSIRKVLKPAFKMAVNDDLVRKNPFDFPITEAVINDSSTREALTPEQQQAYLSFIKNDPHFCQYYDAIYILLHTGLRISEFAGLTVSDIDMEQRRINIDHQLQHEPGRGYYIAAPKTASSRRKIPMTDDVYACFRRLMAKRPTPKVMQIIDEKCGFFYLNEKGMPLAGQDWANRFNSIWEKFTKTNHADMPRVTAHVCRHTFCSEMLRRGMSPKVLQNLMGHKDISTTMNTYAHSNDDDAEIEMRRVANAG